MKTVRAVFEHGVFRPLETVELAEKTEVEFEPRPAAGDANGSDNLAEIYALLSERYQSGEPDTAARHNEHRPWRSTIK